MLALWWSMSGSAWAGEREEAEHQRLHGELVQLAARQSWTGVEKKFAELEKLGVEPTYDELLKGAWAARALGNVRDAYSRLKRASRVEATKEVVDWLYTIDANYGHVVLLVDPSRPAELAISNMPFDPDERTAVAAAVVAVKERGTYDGLLPRGSYTFSGQQFTVEPGISVRIEVSPRLKKTSGELVNVTTSPTWGSGSEPEPKP